jgi:hypothetical protein
MDALREISISTSTSLIERSFMTRFEILLMAASYEKAIQGRDFDTAIPLEKRMIAAAMELEAADDTHPWLTIVKGRNAVRKARKQELLSL